MDTPVSTPKRSHKKKAPALPLYSCKGCGRTNLLAWEMGADSSKPSGLHSRCKACKDLTRKRAPTVLVALPSIVEPEPEPNKEPDVEAMIRRDALILLVKRHEDEYKDLLVMERYRRRPNKGTKADQGKSWVSAGRI